jgi:hypothetical protein
MAREPRPESQSRKQTARAAPFVVARPLLPLQNSRGCACPLLELPEPNRDRGVVVQTTKLGGPEPVPPLIHSSTPQPRRMVGAFLHRWRHQGAGQPSRLD